jgi:hypothetical protein
MSFTGESVAEVQDTNIRTHLAVSSDFVKVFEGYLPIVGFGPNRFGASTTIGATRLNLTNSISEKVRDWMRVIVLNNLYDFLPVVLMFIKVVNFLPLPRILPSSRHTFVYGVRGKKRESALTPVSIL